VTEFLQLNGLTIPVALDQWQEGGESVGGTLRRAVDGTLRRSEVAYKRSWGGRTPLSSAAVRRALAQWIRGDGHGWTLDNTYYSSRGLDKLGASAGAAFATGSARFGAKSLHLPTSSDYVAWSDSAMNTGDWTVMVWRKPAATSLAHYIATSAALCWVDGARNDAAWPAWITYSSGQLSIAGTGASAVYFSELTWLPFALPADLSPGDIYALANARSIATLPVQYAAGDAISPAASVIGTASNQTVRQARFGGSVDKAGAALEFSLAEV
jgi:hypothetical protein